MCPPPKTLKNPRDAKATRDANDSLPMLEPPPAEAKLERRPSKRSSEGRGAPADKLPPATKEHSPGAAGEFPSPTEGDPVRGGLQGIRPRAQVAAGRTGLRASLRGWVGSRPLTVDHPYPIPARLYTY
eukprot:5733255-Pyramimonas_sp.AAC.1